MAHMANKNNRHSPLSLPLYAYSTMLNVSGQPAADHGSVGLLFSIVLMVNINIITMPAAGLEPATY
jgi:hypothetical protein